MGRARAGVEKRKSGWNNGRVDALKGGVHDGWVRGGAHTKIQKHMAPWAFSSKRHSQRVAVIQSQTSMSLAKSDESRRQHIAGLWAT